MALLGVSKLLLLMLAWLERIRAAAAELRVHPGRRSGLEGPGLLRQHLLRNAERGRAGRQRHALHQRLRGLPGLLADAGEHHDGQVSGAHRHHRLHQPARAATSPTSWNRNTKLLPAPYADRLALEEMTLAEALQSGGYATFFAGKWHLGPQGLLAREPGLRHQQGRLSSSGGPYGGDKYFSPYGNPRLSDGPAASTCPTGWRRETCRVHRGAQGRAVPGVPGVLLGPHAADGARGPRDRSTHAKAQADRASHGPSFIPEGTARGAAGAGPRRLRRDGRGDGPGRGQGAATRSSDSGWPTTRWWSSCPTTAG